MTAGRVVTRSQWPKLLKPWHTWGSLPHWRRLAGETPDVVPEAQAAGRITISQGPSFIYAGGEKSRSHGTRSAGGSGDGRWRRRGGEGPSSSPRRRGGGVSSGGECLFSSSVL